MKEPPTVQVVAAKGLNTYAAEGSHDAPRLLRNAVLRAGGWACAPKAQQRLANVQAAVYAGNESNLFVQQSGATYYWNGVTASLVAAGTLLSEGAVSYLPDLVVSGPDYLRPTGKQAQLTPAVIPELPAFDLAVTTPYFYREYSVTQAPLPESDPGWNPDDPPLDFLYSFDPAETYHLIIVPVRGPDAPSLSPYTAPTYITLPAHEAPGRYCLTLRNLKGEANIYMDVTPAGEKLPRPIYYTRTTGGNATLDRFTSSSTPPYATALHQFAPRLAEHHAGRVWVVGGTWFYQPPDDLTPTPVESPKRLWYSDVIVSTENGALPFFAEDYYMDIPFKASRRITALQSVGRYLYVFGDREVLILTGYDDTTWSLESIGDSIGAVVPRSVQRLQQAVIYLSDSGVLLLSGGQATDISGDIRDLLLALDRNNITSTVDFAAEQYLITDGVTTLIYHLREQGWAQRDVDGAGQRLVYGGGAPYSLHGEALHTLDSPQLLPLILRLGAFGDPAWRNTWAGFAGAVDTDAPGCTLTITVHGRDMNMDGDTTDLSTTPQTRISGTGLTPTVARFGVDGVPLSTALIGLELTLTPTPAARRCLLRPPLTVRSSGHSEAWS